MCVILIKQINKNTDFNKPGYCLLIARTDGNSFSNSISFLRRFSTNFTVNSSIESEKIFTLSNLNARGNT